jgi:membrane protease YdiL (CAAX protease family)
MTALLLSVVLAEELFWRGWVLDVCAKRTGPRRGWMLATLLYAATLLPTVVTLAAPLPGPNPMLFVAALFCGLVWTFMAHLIGRLPPVILAHAVFTYFSVVQFRLPGT